MLAISQTNRTKENTGGRFEFTMRRVLTAVGFKIAGQGEKVTAIKISGVSTTGTLSMTGISYWTDLNPPQTTVFTAGTGTDAEATDAMTNIMNGNGYLMMVLQALEPEAKITVSFDGYPDIELPLNTREWGIGRKQYTN